MVGGWIVRLGFLAALSAAFFYYRAHRSPGERDLQIARWSYFVLVVAQLTASALLLFFILDHRFE